MPLFTSPRERQLWTWAASAVAAIWATTGVAGSLAQYVAGTGVVELAFSLGFLAAVIAVVANAVNRPGERRGVWVPLAVIVVYWMVAVRLGAVERTHLFEYGLLAVLIHEALLEGRRHGRSLPAPAPAAIVSTALLGWMDEGIQALFPSRVYDLRDVGVNALAALMAVLASVVLRWGRRRLTGTPG